MGRLADLAATTGYTLSSLASRVRAQPLLLRRIDSGIQAVTPSLARLISDALGVDVSAVRSSCALVTTIDQPRMLVPIPPRLGEEMPPARIYPTGPLPQPKPVTGVLYAFLGPVDPSTSGASVVERYRVTAGGTLVLTQSLLDNEGGDYPDGLLGCISGVVGGDGELWVGGDNVSATDPLTFRVDPVTLELLGASDLYTWVGVGLKTFAKGALDPVSGRVWVTIADGSVYAFDPADVSSGPVVLDLTNGGLTELCCAMSFPGDGYMYAATIDPDNSTVILQKIDPRPGFEAVVAVSPTPVSDPTGTGAFMLEWVPTAGDAGLFYTGAVDGLNAWDPTTLDLAGQPSFDLGGAAVTGGAYDPASDAFWCVAYDFVTPTFPVQLLRGSSIVGFRGGDYNAQFGAQYPPALSLERMAYFSGNDVADTGLQTIFAFSMDAPALAFKIPIGSGGSGTGANNLVGSLLYDPP